MEHIQHTHARAHLPQRELLLVRAVPQLRWPPQRARQAAQARHHAAAQAFQPRGTQGPRIKHWARIGGCAWAVGRGEGVNEGRGEVGEWRGGGWGPGEEKGLSEGIRCKEHHH